MSPVRWRLLLDGPRDGAVNMAIDETLFRSAVQGLAPPTVRLYAWSRPTLSIGFRQNLSETCDLEACRSLGIDTVRRLSGGRAVLHHQELTYCVASGAEGPFRGLSVREVYRWVSSVLRLGLQRKGIAVDSPPSSPRKSAVPSPPPSSDDALPCFAVPTGHEITARGRKLVGGAQKWSRRGFVQHGSILLDVDTGLWSQVIGLDAPTRLGAVGVNELVNPPIERSELMEDLGTEFEGAFGEPASEADLSPLEKETASSLAHFKYSSTRWNVFRKPVAV